MEAVASLRGCLNEESIELVVVAEEGQALGEIPSNWTLRQVSTAPGLLVPEQWGAGLRASSAPLVAFLSAEMRLSARWWLALHRAMANPGIAAAAGGIALAPGSRRAAGAYLSRYSAFLPRPGATDEDRADLPGDATLYRRELLEETAAAVGSGFWEVHYHTTLRRRGWRLRFLGEPLATYAGNPTTVAFMQQRCRHASHFGSMRVLRLRESRWRVVLAAPLVPMILYSRILRRCLASREGRRAMAQGWAQLLLTVAAWAWGEAVGAWRATPER